LSGNINKDYRFAGDGSPSGRGSTATRVRVYSIPFHTTILHELFLRLKARSFHHPRRGYSTQMPFNGCINPDHTGMGKPFGKASTCLREAASAKAGGRIKVGVVRRSVSPLTSVASRSDLTLSPQGRGNAIHPPSKAGGYSGTFL
jgi:hypothetical protein